MAEPTNLDHAAIAGVREGMRIVDAAGVDIGVVDMVKLSDPGAVTTEGQRPPENTSGAGVGFIPAGGPGGAGGGIAGAVPFAVGQTGDDVDPDLPPALAERLVRSGYVKVNTKGLFHRDLYAAADQLDRVDGETVHLTVPRDELTREG